MQTINIDIQKLVDAGLVKMPHPVKPVKPVEPYVYPIYNPKPKFIRKNVRRKLYNKNSKSAMNLKAAELYFVQKTLKEFSEEYNIGFARLKRGAYGGELLKPREMAILALYKAQEPLSSICARLGASLASTNIILWRMRKLRANSAKAA